MIIDLDDIYNKRQYNPSSYEVVVVDSEVIVHDDKQKKIVKFS